jgi:anti-sigma regulatory factor (Ser/Thr protein kinase)
MEGEYTGNVGCSGMTVPSTAGPSGQSKPRLVHEALFYTSEADYLAGCLPFVREGVASGEPTLVAVPEPNLGLLRGEFGDEVRFVDMSVAGRNPGRIIPAVLHAFTSEHPDKPTRIVGEPIWPGRSEIEYVPCVQHEALINLALANENVSVLCPYDARELSPVQLLDATRTHPVLLDGARRWHSPGYTDPVDVVEAYNQPLAEPPPEAEVLIFDASVGPRRVRRFVHDCAELAGMSPERLADLRVAVHELALNTIIHTGQSGILTIWREDGGVVCDVTDSGKITDPLVGRRPPAIYDGVGYGLYLVNVLCDLVEIHRLPNGTSIRVHVSL